MRSVAWLLVAGCVMTATSVVRTLISVGHSTDVAAADGGQAGPDGAERPGACHGPHATGHSDPRPAHPGLPAARRWPGGASAFSWRLPLMSHLIEDEQMRGSRRRRQDAATDASLLLVQDALVQIRAMAHLRRDLSAGDGEGNASGDYHERIRLIADVCENLP